MDFRKAQWQDLPQLQEIYRALVQDLNQQNIRIWDDAYPMEFFRLDLEKERLWLLAEGEEILGAFALCKTDPGAKHVAWEKPEGQAVYMARLGVALSHRGKGLGKRLMELALAEAKNQGAEYLRLFVADCNPPAIGLYESIGFQKGKGLYELRIDETMVLYEYGMERRV